MRPLPLNKTVVLTLALAGLVTSACVKSNPPGVGLVKVDTAAVFGVTKAEPPAGFSPSVDLGQNALEIPLADLPTFDLVGRSPDKVLSNELCPVADTRKAFPKESASVNVKGLAPEGVYTWKKDRIIAVNRLAKPPVKVIQGQLESRLIRRVTKTPGNDHQFSFEMVAPNVDNPVNFDVTTFIVNTNPTLLVNERVESRTVGVVPVPGQDVRVAPQNDYPGIFISKVETQNANGGKIGGFAPLRPMLVFPLEEAIVRSGQTFSAIGIDPVSGDVLVNDGVVNATSRIDACGEIVEGYTVTIKQTYTGDFNTTDPEALVGDVDLYGAADADAHRRLHLRHAVRGAADRRVAGYR